MQVDISRRVSIFNGMFTVFVVEFFPPIRLAKIHNGKSRREDAIEYETIDESIFFFL